MDGHPRPTEGGEDAHTGHPPAGPWDLSPKLLRACTHEQVEREALGPTEGWLGLEKWKATRAGSQGYC